MIEQKHKPNFVRLSKGVCLRACQRVCQVSVSEGDE